MNMQQIRELGALSNIRTCSKVLGCSERYVRHLCETGRIKAIKLGAHWRVNTASLLAYAGIDIDDE